MKVLTKKIAGLTIGLVALGGFTAYANEEDHVYSANLETVFETIESNEYLLSGYFEIMPHSQAMIQWGGTVLARLSLNVNYGFPLLNGDRVSILSETNDGWVRVRALSGISINRVGYVMSEQIRR